MSFVGKQIFFLRIVTIVHATKIKVSKLLRGLMEHNSFDCIIVGAGVCGAALGNLLLKKKISFVIIEKESCLADTPNQGFSLTLQRSSYECLKFMGLFEDLSKAAVHQIKQSFLYGLTGEEVLVREMKDEDRLPLARLVLRQKLLEAVEGNVRWNTKVSKITSSSDSVEVTCENNSVFTGKLVFACDGVHSKIRSLTLPSIQPNEFNLFNVYGRVIDIDYLLCSYCWQGFAI